MKKWIKAVAASLLLAASSAYAVNQSYTTDWVANTYGTNVSHVENAARSMWVDPATTGSIYTATMWDENGTSYTNYVNGVESGGWGAHGESQGRALTCNTTNCWSGIQWQKTGGNGMVYRYVRTTHAMDQTLVVSADSAERHADVITGAANWGQFLAFSDHPGARVWFGKTDGTLIAYWNVTDPGALAFDRNGNLWVAQESTGAILQFNNTGTQIGSIQMPAGSVPHSLWFEASTQYLWVGDAGPDQQAKVYKTDGSGTLVSTFGVKGGYLDTTTGTKGQLGSMRFASIDGLGKDAAGNLYVLSQPPGQSWDNGRTSGTMIYAYSPAGALLYTLNSMNFEAIASPDPSVDATDFYSGTNIYHGTGGADWVPVANTVDPFKYPADERLVADSTKYPGRGIHFGMVATVGVNRLLAAGDQNPDGFVIYHFNPAVDGYTAIQDGALGLLGGAPFGNTNRVRHGFCLASNGDVWAGMDRSTTITQWPLSGFDANGKPSWGTPVQYNTPATLGVLGRVIYLPESDTMILADIITGSTDWTSIGTRVEVYHGWIAGNQTNPVVINLTSTNPKTLAAAGNYLFVGYVHTVPNIDAFNLTTGTLDNTLINSNPSNVYVGNDVDSMYGLRAVVRANGEYVVAKDNYNGSSIVIYRWVP